MKDRCTCGAELKSEDRRGLALHMRGVAHRQPEIVRQMLADRSLSLRELGRRLKLTGERVRQLAILFEIDRKRGREQLNERFKEQRKKLLQKRQEGFPQRATPALRKKLARLRSEGYQVLASLCGNGMKSMLELDIDGHRCTIRVTRQPPRSLRSGTTVKYYSFRLKRRSADFVLFHIEERNITYVVPVGWLGSGEMSWVPVGRIEGYHNAEQRDWEQWREAWSQLKRVKK